MMERRYPVLHIDVSMAKGKPDEDALSRALMLQLEPFTDIYGVFPSIFRIGQNVFQYL